MNNDIDIVVPWVDGSDPVWQKVRSDCLGCDGDGGVNRYRDWGLMKYWFRGVEKYLPWVRKIHFVTFGHIPEGIKREHPKLNIVNHKDYIPKEYLPTFNADVIEMNIFRIKGLSEKFIYANDDTLFLRSIKPEFFFKNDLPVDAPIIRVFQFHSRNLIFSLITNDLLLLNENFSKKRVIRENMLKWLNPVYGTQVLKNLYFLPLSHFTGFYDQHMPNAFLKSTLNEVYEKCKPAFLTTFSHPVRNRDDVNQWLFRYWQFATGKFTPGNPNRGAFLSIGADDDVISRTIKSQSMPMICVSDDKVDIDYEKEKQFLIDCFETILPEKSSFEI
ncbi:MAG: Stealth CR1 domain-containing protein [Clostridia bacterium]|nr:Stealth CR1 domain-containing protein [Clostridia bacterium]